MENKEHLWFYETLSKSGKTKVIEVKSRHDGSHLGIIKWKPSWRCYCFFPDTDYETFWSYDCLYQLVERIRQLEVSDGKR